MTSVPGAVTVEEVRPRDADRLGELVAQAYVAAGILTVDDDYAATLRDVAGRAARALVTLAAYDHDEVLGGLTLAAAGSPEAEIALDGEVEVRKLGVAPQHQRRRVAEALLSAAAEHARAAGATALVLSLLDGNRPAERLYRRCGFERVPQRDWVAGWDLKANVEGTALMVRVHRLALAPATGAGSGGGAQD